MSPDLMTANGHPEIMLTIQGEGFSLTREKFALNPFGKTHYRTQENGLGPINEWVLEASVIDEIAACEVHTHDAQGKHVSIFSANGLRDGDVVEKEISLALDGRKIPLHITLKYLVQR